MIKEILPNGNDKARDVLDIDGNVRSLADYEVALNDEETALKEALEERDQALAEWDMIEDKSPGVYVTLEQHRQDMRDLLDFVSGSLMRRGFKKAASTNKDIHERYKENLPQVESGAERIHRRSVHRDLPRIYHADELIAAGFDSEEVIYDAKTQMRIEAQQRLGGPTNKSKRAALRKKLQ